MTRQLELDILPQPNDTTCGPTCLHSVYSYFGDDVPLDQVIDEIPTLHTGGTLAVSLGCHALKRGFQATIYTYNLTVFDPTWFLRDKDLVHCLHEQMAAKSSAKLRAASQTYINFVELGGKIHMQDLNASLLRRYLKRSIPILTGLSSTFLYQCEREIDANCKPDDVRGVPTGHFVVLCGYDKQKRMVRVADPYLPNPLGENHYYEVGLDRLVCAILLGVLTYDANLLVVEPARGLSRDAAPPHKDG